MESFDHYGVCVSCAVQIEWPIPSMVEGQTQNASTKKML